MTNFHNMPAVLLLQDGTVFKGVAIGKIGTTLGEICFNTGATGYQEVFTDPSYYGQIMVATHPHIGTYGIKEDESQSERIQIKGLVCKDFSEGYSRHVAQQSTQEFFESECLIGISGIDTRSLVRHIRDKGAMNAIISSENLNMDELKSQLNDFSENQDFEYASKVTTSKVYYHGDEDASTRVAVLDLGVKRNILKNLDDRQVFMKVFPARTTYAEMKEWGADGYLISNGPGDPSTLDYAVETVKEILDDDKPLFGICLGHQVLALANGVKTEKMLNGHRGCNQPVKNLLTNKSEITSQNHGYTVSREQVESNPNLEITHINLNDGTVEGIRVKDKKAFSIQYHPEAGPGPHDSKYLFDQFIAMIKG